jgi:asparagine synthase (glutamine-hydrolysing)
MCGFVGFTGASKDNEKTLSRMLSTIVHRGPDSHDVFLDDGVSLGFRRLSIIDLSNGSQPLSNEDGTKVLVFNGEIYNYKVLREELLRCGHIFKTHTDSEVLLHGYEEYGTSLLQKVRGMFAFVIWDSQKKELFGARDFFGIKPFYYTVVGNEILFGSEIKAFLPHPDFKKELFEEKLSDYLTWSCVPGNETFFKGVYKLPPAQYFVFKAGKMDIQRYWRPEFHIDSEHSEDYFVDKVSQGVSESVKAHMIADVEVGCFLSSGVDSSYVASELSHLSKIKTYTVGFDDLRYSEAPEAQRLANELGVQNKVTIVSAEDYFGSVGKVQYHLDEPLANPSANLLYFVSKLASRDLKVVLSGEGADEMFGGYNVYKEPLAIASYQRLPLLLRRTFASFVGKLPDFKGKNFIIRGSKTIEERYIGNSNIFSQVEKEQVLLRKYPSKKPTEYLAPFYKEVQGQDDVTKMQYVDMHFWMVQEILLKADKMSMAHSLELRVPFLDREIFDIARTIPARYKVSKENTKLALRKAAGRQINQTSAERVKMAFPLPLVEWLREDRYYNMVKEYFTNDVAKKFFNTNEITKLLDIHKSGKKNNARKIWTIFTFLVWYEEFFIKSH